MFKSSNFTQLYIDFTMTFFENQNDTSDAVAMYHNAICLNALILEDPRMKVHTPVTDAKYP